MSDDKLDAKIAHKEAEYANVARATAILLETHERIRLEFDAEMEDKAKKADIELDTLLASKKEELKKLKDSLSKLESDFKSQKNAQDEALRELSGTFETTSRELESVKAIITELNSQKLTLEAELTVKKNEQTHLITEIDKRRTELTDLDQKKAISLEEISNLNWKLANLKANYKSEEESLNAQIQEATNTLATLNAKSDEANAKLIEAQRQEENIRDDISTRLKQLDIREENINERESKVALDEKRAYNYRKFTQM